MDTNEDTITIDRPVVGTASSLLVAEPEEGNDTEQVISLAVNGETDSSLLVVEPEEGNSAEEICSLDANEELEESMSDMDMVLKHLGSFVRIWVILLIHTDALPGYNHTPARLVLLGVFAWVFGILTLVGLFIENNLFTSTVRRYFGFCSVALELAYIFAALFSVGLAIASDATIAGRIAVPILLFLDTLLAVVQIKMSLQYWAQHSELLVAFKSGSIVAWWKYPLLIRSWHMLSSFKVPFACKSSAPDFVVLVVLLFEVIVSRIGWFFNHEMDGVFNVATVFIAIQVALFALKWRLAKIYTDFLRFWVDIVYIVFITGTTLVYMRGPWRNRVVGGRILCIMLVLPMPLLGCCHVDFLREASIQMRVAYASFAMSLLGLGLVLATDPSFCGFDEDACWGFIDYKDRSELSSILCYVGVGCAVVPSGVCALMVNGPWNSFIKDFIKDFVKDSEDFVSVCYGRLLCFSNFVLGILCVAWWVYLSLTRINTAHFSTYLFCITSLVVSSLLWRTIRSLKYVASY
mmetsp:Transcript_2224/g.3524  ORF Transcript_2224/g.3524 Transcript_2224/m.3524 type:complete len:520 (+) Transcript_2224:370-1929(+)